MAAGVAIASGAVGRGRRRRVPDELERTGTGRRSRGARRVVRRTTGTSVLSVPVPRGTGRRIPVVHVRTEAVRAQVLRAGHGVWQRDQVHAIRRVERRLQGTARRDIVIVIQY